MTCEMKIILLIVIFQCILIANSADSSLELILEVEKLAKIGAERAADLFKNRCNQDVDQCSSQVYAQCSTYMPDDMTVSHKEVQATSCKKPGIYSNYNAPGGRCALSEKCNSEYDKRIICSQGSLFEDFYYIAEKEEEENDGEGNNTDEQDFEFDQQEKTSIRQKKDASIVYQYAGFINSYFTIYPFIHNAFECDECIEYDPRARSWYVGGITGAKNLILILDISGSMTGKMTIAKEAAVQVVQTLGYSDFFQIVIFNDKAVTVDGKQNLMQATSNNKSKIIKKIEEIKESGGTNFEAAFQKAFNVMDDTKTSDDDQFKCLNVILFMTDGYISSGESDETILLNYIKTRNNYYQASIFTYSLGKDADANVPNKIACQNKGIWYSVTENSNNSLKTVMSSYYSYLAVGIQLEEVLWSEIYKSSSLGVEMITATVPIFFIEEESNQRMLLGVFGADVLIQELDEFQDFRESVLPDILKRGRNLCVQNTLTECQIENMRSEKCFPLDQCETLPFKPPTCKNSITKNWKKETDGSNSGKYASICQGTDSSDFPFCWYWWHYVLIGLAGVIGILIIVIAVILYVKKKKRKQELEYGIGV